MALPQRYVEKAFYTEAEYLAHDEDVPYKLEYVGGQILPLNAPVWQMPGVTVNHAVLSAAVGGALWQSLQRSEWRVLAGMMKVRTPSGSIRYPDASVVGKAVTYHGEGTIVITNPVLLVEVLSPGTEAIDRGEKLHEYQGIESLQSFLLVEQRLARVEQYARTSSGEWTHQTAQGLSSTLTIPALNATLSLADIYDGIDFTDAQNG